MVFLCWVLCVCLSVSVWPGCLSLPLHAGRGENLPALDDVTAAHYPAAAHQYLPEDSLYPLQRLPADPHSIVLGVGEAGRDLLRELSSGSDSSADSSFTSGSLMEALQQQGIFGPVDATGADLSGASMGSDYIVDPRFLALLDDLISQQRLSQETVPVDTPSRSSSSSSSSNSIMDSDSMSNTMPFSKRGSWRGLGARYARSRPQGLSLSIDASMKVLREALYLEIARKKQRQHQLRAAHNHQLLQTIGKRDTTRQLQQQSQTN
ncbi:unnamed protein product [Meganyctiphanes norvegica]|uniref:Corticotropin-releasing factor domain-containing protein n=1 Tax=Meganyctiphanes norvegica TaxID=48144 RepID=A0AAV2QT82_MEGNR